MVDKNNTLIVRNVSETTHKLLRVLSASMGLSQGDTLQKSLQLAMMQESTLIQTALEQRTDAS